MLGPAAEGEGQAAPAVAGVGHVVVGPDRGARLSIRPRRRVVVERADVGGDRGEGAAQRRAPGPGAEQQELGRGGAVGVLSWLLSVSCATRPPEGRPAGQPAAARCVRGNNSYDPISWSVGGPAAAPPARWHYCAKFTTVNRPTLRASPAST